MRGLTILPPKPPAPPKRTTTFRVPPDLLEAIDKAAAETNNTRTEVMIRFLRHGLDRYLSEKTKTRRSKHNP